MSDSEKPNEPGPIELQSTGKATEALLRAMALPDSRVDRDVLMYQAGFEAATALHDHASESVVRHGSGKTNRFWPALTAVCATTAAACLTMLYLDANQVQQPIESSSAMAVVEVIEDGNPEEETSDWSPVELASLPKSSRSRRPLETLLGLTQDRSHRQRISNVARDLRARVSPVSWNSDREAVGKPLTSGSVLNAEKLIKDWM